MSEAQFDAMLGVLLERRRAYRKAQTEPARQTNARKDDHKKAARKAAKASRKANRK